MPTVFDTQVDEVLLAIEQAIEQIQSSAPDIDFESQGGILTLEVGQATLILSRQSATQEIWLACPDGGFHFQYHDGQWVTRKGEVLTTLLTEIIARYAGVVIPFSFSNP